MGNISILKRRFFPSFYETEAPKLIEFFKYYLEWMEQEDNPYWTIDNIHDFTDIDGSIDKYIEHLKYELMLDFPLEYAGDLRYIMKHLVMLYQSKGTINSLKFFFRAVYNSFCNVTYPRVNILKASDGKWIQGYYIYSADIIRENISSFVNKTVIEVETGLTGVVNAAVPHYFKDEEELKYCLVIIDNLKQFTAGNTLRIYGEDESQTYEITQTEFSKGYWENTDGFISSDKLLQDGYYYQNFSYEITSLVPIAEYREIVEKLFHPAGLKMFGKVQLTEQDEEISKPATTFLRWWIINMFMHVLAEERYIISNAWTIKNNPAVYGFPWTADTQYYFKDYGNVDCFEDMTPNQLYNETTDSNRLVFSDGKQINIDWATYNLLSSVEQYSVAGIYSEQPVIRTTCTNGEITLKIDEIPSDNPFIFVNGIKIQKSQVTKTETGYSISSGVTGDATLYFLTNNTVTRSVKTELTENTVELKGSKKNRILVFIDGIYVSDSIEYSAGIVTLPQNNGYMELYELQDNELLLIKDYTIKNNDNNTLFCILPNKVRYTFGRVTIKQI